MKMISTLTLDEFGKTVTAWREARQSGRKCWRVRLAQHTVPGGALWTTRLDRESFLFWRYKKGSV